MATPVNNPVGFHCWEIPAPATRDSVLQLWEREGNAKIAIEEANRIQDVGEREQTIKAIFSGPGGILENPEFDPESLRKYAELVRLIENAGIRNPYVEDLHKLALEAGDGFAHIAEMHSNPDTCYFLTHEARKAREAFVGKVLTSDSSEEYASNLSDEELDERKRDIEQANHLPPTERTREMMGIFFDKADNLFRACWGYGNVINYAEGITDRSLRDEILEKLALYIFDEEDIDEGDRDLMELIVSKISDRQIGEKILQQFEEKLLSSEEELSDF